MALVRGALLQEASPKLVGNPCQGQRVLGDESVVEPIGPDHSEQTVPQEFVAAVDRIVRFARLQRLKQPFLLWLAGIAGPVVRAEPMRESEQAFACDIETPPGKLPRFLVQGSDRK